MILASSDARFVSRIRDAGCTSIAEAAQAFVTAELKKSDDAAVMLQVGVDFLNYWRTRVGMQHRCKVSDENRQLCECYLRMLGSVVLAMLMEKLSRIDFGPALPRRARDGMRKVVLDYFLAQNVEGAVEMLTEEDVARHRVLRRMVVSREKMMQQQCVDETDAFGIGNVMRYFLALDRLLTPVVGNADVGSARNVMWTLCRGQPKFHQWNWLRIARIADEDKIAGLLRAREVFGQDVIAAIQRLQSWLGFRRGVRALPPLAALTA